MSQPARRSFRTQAELLGAWLQSTGGPPARGSADADERRLAEWRAHQLRRLGDGSLSPEREAHLDEVAPGWRPARGPEAFQARAAELGQWLRSTGKLPYALSSNEQERRLGSWRQNQLTLLAAGTLRPEYERYLDQVAHGWRPTSWEQRFRARADELGRWIVNSAGVLPFLDSEDLYERRLAEWRHTQLGRLRTGELSTEREWYLDEVAPGWRPTRGPDVQRSRAEELGRWLASADGRLPSARCDDPHERGLGVWRWERLADLRKGTLSPELEQYLDEVAPGWRPRNQIALKEFPAQARALGEWFVWSDGKVPDGTSDDWYERRLEVWRRKWLRQLRTGTLPSEHEKYLDEVAPGWRPRAASGIDEFPARAEAVGRWFASTDGKVPSGFSDDPHERRMFRWRQGWMFHLRNGTLSAEHEKYLDEVAPGWRPRHR